MRSRLQIPAPPSSKQLRDLFLQSWLFLICISFYWGLTCNGIVFRSEEVKDSHPKPEIRNGSNEPQGSEKLFAIPGKDWIELLNNRRKPLSCEFSYKFLLRHNTSQSLVFYLTFANLTIKEYLVCLLSVPNLCTLMVMFRFSRKSCSIAFWDCFAVSALAHIRTSHSSSLSPFIATHLFSTVVLFANMNMSHKISTTLWVYNISYCS